MEASKRSEKDLSLADEFLEDAETLYRIGSLRSAESRLYYSIFHAARALLFEMGMKAKTHKGTISLFGEKIISEGVVDERYSKLLSRSFSAREAADYRTDVDINVEELEERIEESKSFISEIREKIGQR
ncbi:MAG: HEPN domain-containing protein [Archaeoglobaceae archaeon]